MAGEEQDSRNNLMLQLITIWCTHLHCSLGPLSSQPWERHGGVELCSGRSGWFLRGCYCGSFMTWSALHLCLANALRDSMQLMEIQGQVPPVPGNTGTPRQREARLPGIPPHLRKMWGNISLGTAPKTCSPRDIISLWGGMISPKIVGRYHDIIPPTTGTTRGARCRGLTGTPNKVGI
jgi:hypothetical protein